MLVYQGLSKTETAKELNLAPQTLSKWLNPSKFPEVVKEFEKELKIAENMRKRNYKAVAMKAQDKLVELIDSEKQDIAIKACKEILDRAGDIPVETENELDDETKDDFLAALEGKVDEVWNEETSKE